MRRGANEAARERLSPRDETDAMAMRAALECARDAFERGEVPVGAVLSDARGAIVARGANAPIAMHDPTAHAEVLTLRAAGQRARQLPPVR